MISVDSDKGLITLENSGTKAVIDYRHGGHICELYKQPSSVNLVSVIDYGPVNAPKVSPLWAGVGGVGCTDIYGTDALPETDNGFSDLRHDLNARLNYYTVYYHDLLVLSFDATWYTVWKSWKLLADGVLALKITWLINRTGYYSEPATKAKFLIGDYSKWRKYGTPWGSTVKETREIDIPKMGPSECHTWDKLNMFVADWVELTGSASHPTIKMTNVRNGSAKIAANRGQVMEQVSGTNGQGAGDNTINWATWWGGNPPDKSRYSPMTKGAKWSDTFLIELI
ncbi:MAG: hypothetical protein ACYC5F_06165 [Thermoleophilia bacterium]